MARPRKKKRSPAILIWFILFLAGVVILARLTGQKVAVPDRSAPGVAMRTPPAERLQAQVAGFFRQAEFDSTWIRRKAGETVVRVPADLHPLIVYQALAKIVKKQGGEITRATERRKSGAHTFAYALNDRIIETIRLVPDTTLKRKSGKIAIIMDDFGYNMSAAVRAFIDFPYTVTYAIIPGLPNTDRVAAMLRERNKPMLIHMPMEPQQGRVEAEGFTLFTRLSPEDVRQRMRLAIKALPFAIGVNNHMGSKATADSSVMWNALLEIKRANLFYIDSRTSPKSVAYALAQKLGVPSLINNVFIDAIDDAEHVKEKLFRLEKMARKYGTAVGIAHPRARTLEAFREVLPMLELHGTQLVLVEDLLDLRYARKE